MKYKTKNVAVVFARAITMQSYEDLLINVPLNASTEEIQAYLEEHIDAEPWCSLAEVDVSEVDAAEGEETFDVECGGEVPVTFDADYILTRDANGDLCMESPQSE